MADQAGPGLPGVLFREYQEGDIQHCARLAKEAWPAKVSMGSADRELLGMEAYMRFSRESSNYTEVAYTDEEVVGFLFGRIEGLEGTDTPPGLTLGELPSMVGRFLRLRNMDLGTLRLLWSLSMTELKLKVALPESDASVEMFIVGSRYRGKGVGSGMLDRFLKAAGDAGGSTVTLYTDDTMCDWGFYERHGFRRVTTFRDNVTSHYSGSDARGIVYSLDLGCRPRDG